MFWVKITKTTAYVASIGKFSFHKDKTMSLIDLMIRCIYHVNYVYTYLESEHWSMHCVCNWYILLYVMWCIGVRSTTTGWNNCNKTLPNVKTSWATHCFTVIVGSPTTQLETRILFLGRNYCLAYLTLHSISSLTYLQEKWYTHNGSEKSRSSNDITPFSRILAIPFADRPVLKPMQHGQTQMLWCVYKIRVYFYFVSFWLFQKARGCGNKTLKCVTCLQQYTEIPLRF